MASATWRCLGPAGTRKRPEGDLRLKERGRVSGPKGTYDRSAGTRKRPDGDLGCIAA